MLENSFFPQNNNENDSGRTGLEPATLCTTDFLQFSKALKRRVRKLPFRAGQKAVKVNSGNVQAKAMAQANWEILPPSRRKEKGREIQMGNFFLEAGFLCSQNHPLFDNKYKVYEFKIHFLDLNSKIVSQFDIWLGKNSEWWAGPDSDRRPSAHKTIKIQI